MNSLGETRLFYTGILEPKPCFKARTSQGIIDLVMSHFQAMNDTEDKKIVFMVAHHNQIHEFMRIFNRNEAVEKKPVYCWTGCVELEYDPLLIENNF